MARASLPITSSTRSGNPFGKQKRGCRSCKVAARYEDPCRVEVVSPKSPRSTKFARSVITNDMRALPAVDARTVWARRRKDLILALSEEVSACRRAPITGADRLFIADAAAVQVSLEQLQVRIARGEPVNVERLIRLSGVITRMLRSLGLSRHDPTAEVAAPSPTIRQYQDERDYR